MSVLLSLGSAVTYGVADFTGGLASRRLDPLTVTGCSQAIGVLLAPLLLVLFAAPVSPAGLIAGAAAGIFGGLGLALYFTALRDGAMGVVSPLSAVAAAGVPIAAGVVAGERPAVLAVLGIAVALPAIYLAARPPAPAESSAGGLPGINRPRGSTVIGRPRSAVRTGHLPPGVLTGLASGVAFGVFFTLLDAAPDASGAWPLLGSKLGSLAVVVVLAVGRRRQILPWRIDGGVPAGTGRLLLASGALDMLANLLFLLATREGLLSLVSVISSQYPVVVVVLSVVVLRERLVRTQQAGVVLALLAVGLISVA